MFGEPYSCPKCRKVREPSDTVCLDCANIDPELTAAEKAQARKLFDGQIVDAHGTVKTACIYCGGLHDGPGAPLPTLKPIEQPCPRIKRIERHLDGTVLTIEFWPPGAWESGTVFPRDVNEDDEGDPSP